MSSYPQTPDLTAVVSQAKSHYALHDKFTGQVLGYALLITDQPVSADQVLLVPWHGGGQLPPVEGFDMVLASDLDLSQDSSINGTMEEELSSQTNDGTDDQGNSLPLAAAADQDTIVHHKSSSLTAPKATIYPPSLQISESVTPTDPTLFSSSLVTHSPTSYLPVITITDSTSPVSPPPNLVTFPSPSNTSKLHLPPTVKMVTQSLASEIAATLNRDNSANKPIDDHLKRKNIENKGQFLPGRPGRYGAFYEDMSEDGVAKQYRKVKCLLCGDGKLLSLSNFHRHIKARHEPTVKCDNCGREFNGEQIRRHRKNCSGHYER